MYLNFGLVFILTYFGLDYYHIIPPFMSDVTYVLSNIYWGLIACAASYNLFTMIGLIAVKEKIYRGRKLDPYSIEKLTSCIPLVGSKEHKIYMLTNFVVFLGLLGAGFFFSSVIYLVRFGIGNAITNIVQEETMKRLKSTDGITS